MLQFIKNRLENVPYSDKFFGLTFVYPADPRLEQLARERYYNTPELKLKDEKFREQRGLV